MNDIRRYYVPIWHNQLQLKTLSIDHFIAKTIEYIRMVDCLLYETCLRLEVDEEHLWGNYDMSVQREFGSKAIFKKTWIYIDYSTPNQFDSIVGKPTDGASYIDGSLHSYLLLYTNLKMLLLSGNMKHIPMVKHLCLWDYLTVKILSKTNVCTICVSVTFPVSVCDDAPRIQTVNSRRNTAFQCLWNTNKFM